MISIIIPFYNKHATIERAMESVIHQTYKNWEIIIVDDCSKVPPLIPDECKQYSITLVHNKKNLGPGPSRQHGMNLAKGDYLAFLDADDWWAPTFLEDGMAQLNSNNKLLATWCPARIYTDTDTVGHIRRYNDIKHINLLDALLKYGHSIQTSAFLWHKKFCGEWGTLSTNQDSWFEYSSCLNATQIHKINKTLLFRDESGNEHRKKYVNEIQQKQNTFQLYLFVKEKHKKLTMTNRILLFNRIAVAFMKIKLVHPCSQNDSSFKENFPIYTLFFGTSIFFLRLTHKILQKTPFKIYF